MQPVEKTVCSENKDGPKQNAGNSLGGWAVAPLKGEVSAYFKREIVAMFRRGPKTAGFILIVLPFYLCFSSPSFSVTFIFPVKITKRTKCLIIF